jgi:formylglycine-generating enzyme
MPPSCQGQPAICGATATDSCCASTLVPGGTYYRGYDMAGLGDESYPATVSDFRLDNYEVTVGRFRAFLAAGKGTQANPPRDGDGAHTRIPDSGWKASWNFRLKASHDVLVASVQCDSDFQTWTGNELQPMNCITWYEAMAFCIWDGGYLPTEAEWNYAAAGGNEQRAYPWSEPASELSLNSELASYGCVSDTSCSRANLVPVGSKPGGQGRWTHSDLAGNVFEWNLDYYKDAYPATCLDCAQLDEATNRMARGGSFYFHRDNMRSGIRTSRPSIERDSSFGVRCARRS